MRVGETERHVGVGMAEDVRHAPRIAQDAHVMARPGLGEARRQGRRAPPYKKEEGQQAEAGGAGRARLAHVGA
jgi:hypothetical protein